MNGIAGMEPDNLSSNLQPLFETILRVPMAKVDPTKSLQMLIANIDYDEFKGIMISFLLWTSVYMMIMMIMNSVIFAS